jgi:isocitrate dehydrogenase
MIWWPLPLNRTGGFLWACKNYDGDVQSDVVAQGFGSLGLMTSVLLTPDGNTCRNRGSARHGHAPLPTVSTRARHINQPDCSIFAWSRGLYYRGTFDGTPDVTNYALALESACVDTVENGHMTKDLAALIGPDQPYLNTTDFMDAVAKRLAKNLGLKNVA